MRNMLALIGAGTVTFLVLGWYLGWYKIDGNPLTGKQNVNVEINPEKITKDVKKGVQIGVERGSEFIQDVSNRNGNDKPAPLTTPPANNNQTTTPPSSGWLSIPPALKQPTKPSTATDDDRLFGISLPRR